MDKYYKVNNKIEFVSKVAELIFIDYKSSIKKNNRFNLALTGGKTPIDIYIYLRENYFSLIDWNLVYFYFVDDRDVSINSNESNYNNAKINLFDFLDNPNVFRFLVETNPDMAIKVYEKEIKNITINTALLGMGEDGHVGSIFPNSEELNTNSLVVHTKKKYNEYNRYSFSINTINKIENNILIISNNRNKLEILLSEDKKYPINLIKNKKIVYYR